MISKKCYCIFLLSFICLTTTYGQKEKKERVGEFYFSWGYNAEWYTNSDVHVSQPSLGNDYTLQNVHGHDHEGWNEGIFNQPISIPQYNYRIGYFFNKKKGLGVEINFDHTKYIIADNQQVNITGTLQGNTTGSVVFSDANGYRYFLNNGANFLLFNLVKRWNWFGESSRVFKIDFLAKAGVGPVIPHVENRFQGNDNKPHFQIGGWNAGVEGDIRITFFKHVYLEYCNKLDYASYYNLKIYQGTARQNFGSYQMILNLGVTFPFGKKI